MTKIEVMKAFEDGLLIERKRRDIPVFFNWDEELRPMWNWEKFDYRVKDGIPIEINIIYDGNGYDFRVEAANNSVLNKLMAKGKTTFKEVLRNEKND